MVIRAVAWAALATALAGGGAAAQVEVDARLEPARIVLGETADLVISVTGAGVRTSVEEPTLPDLGPIRVVATGRESEVRLVGTTISRRTVFRFTLRPEAAGTLRVDPARVIVDGTVHRTPIQRLLVVDPGGDLAGWRARAEEDVADGPPAIFAVMRADRQRVWVGEQVTLTFSFYHDPRLPLTENPDYEPPDTPGFWRVELDDGPAVSRERIGRRSYHVQRFRYALFPLRSGEFTVGPAVVRVVEPDPVRWWRAGRPRTIETDPLTVVAMALPAGAPAGFAGAVGRYRLTGGVLERDAAVGSPLELRLTVEGTGNPSVVPPPALPDWPDVSVRPPAVESTTTVRDERVQGRKTFRWLLVPDVPGSVDLGIVRLPFFDPAAGAFVVDTVRLGEIRIAAGGRTPKADAAAERDRGPTLWPARDPRPPAVSGLTRVPWYWAALAGPWLAWLLAAGVTRRRARRPDARARRRAAIRRLDVAIAGLAGGAPDGPARAAEALDLALAECGVQLEGAGPRERRARMAAATVPRVVAEAAEDARAAIAAAAYADQPGRAAATALGEFARVLKKTAVGGPGHRGAAAGTAALIVVSAGLALGSEAATDDARSAWEAANRAYRAGEFAAAEAGYRALLARHADPRLEADLAATLWRAGRAGEAVAHYLAALEMEPRNDVIRSDLTRLRRQLGDPPAGPRPVAPFLDRTRLDELLLALLLVDGAAFLAVVLAGRHRRRALAAALVLVAAMAGAAALQGARAGDARAVAVADAVIAARPGGEAIGRVPEGAVVEVLQRAPAAWRIRVAGTPAGWVASENLAPLD